MTVMKPWKNADREVAAGKIWPHKRILSRKNKQFLAKFDPGTGEVAIHRSVKLILTALCGGLLFSACATAAPAAKKPSEAVPQCQTLGSLVSTSGLRLFNDAKLSVKTTEPETIGIALKLAPPAQILLSSGRVVWTSQIPDCLPTVVRAQHSTIQASTLPLTQEGEEGFAWKEVAITSPLTVTAVSRELNLLTPKFVAAQGRQLNSKAALRNFNLPQFNVVVEGQSLWGDLNDLRFATATPIDIKGLVQKPFLSITHTLPPIEVAQYRDFTEKTVSEQPLPKLKWQLEQVIIPERQAPGLPVTVALYSGEGNCTIFQVAWTQSVVNYFGYCKAGSAAPTPIITQYKIATNNQSLVINILEVSGDMETPAEFTVVLKNGVPLINRH